MYQSHAETTSIPTYIFPTHDASLGKQCQLQIRPTAITEKRNKITTRKSILVVDDEPGLVNRALSFFEGSGFHAYGFSDAESAINWYQAHFNEVVLIFVDMKMPKMTGQKCFGALKAINPRAQIVLMSGSVEQYLVTELLKNGAVCFVQKPVDYSEVASWLLEYLTGKPLATFESTLRHRRK